jgi:hypothetical protein
MWIRWSAKTSRVLVAFSIVNFVLPPFPANRPIARDRCSPRSVCAVHAEKKTFSTKHQRVHNKKQGANHVE